MLTEKDYCDVESTKALESLGMNVYTSFCGVDVLKHVLLYEAQKWLREEKRIIVDVFIDDDSDTPITYNIYKDGKCVCHHHGKYWPIKEWREALSESIKGAIKLLKEEK